MIDLLYDVLSIIIKGTHKQPDFRHAFSICRESLPQKVYQVYDVTGAVSLIVFHITVSHNLDKLPIVIEIPIAESATVM